MTRLRRPGAWGLAGLVVLLLGAGYLGQQEVMGRAFDRLEADQVSQDAQRVRLALDAEIRLLNSFGATNSYWDDSFQNVKDADAQGFAVSFPPADLKSVYGVDGVLGVGLDGRLRVGGLASDGARFGALPAQLRDPATLGSLFDPSAESGTSQCGALTTATVPYLYCGFGSFDGSGRGPSGGLIFLRALDPASLTTIGRDIGLPLTLVTSNRPGAQAWPSLPSRSGRLQVSTTTLGDDIALDVEVPTRGGGFTVEAVRDRPIHGAAVTVGRQLFGLLVLLGAVVLVGLVVALRQNVRRQVEPLRRTAEAVIASGDRNLRVGGDGRSEIGALGRAIDSMLDTLAEQEQRLARDRAGREQELAASFEERRRAQDEARTKAQEVIAGTAADIGRELADVTLAVEEVRAAARSIHERVDLTGRAARDAVAHAAAADSVAAALGDSLQRVTGIASTIRTVADQTKLLALNATIEAERAGEAGRGFSVVASEVKALAAGTARSTDEIAETVEALTARAGELTAAMADVVGRIEEIGAGGAALQAVAESQQEVLQSLDERVGGAVDRIEAMTRL